MANSIWYSQALAETWKAFNKHNGKVSAEDFREKTRQLIFSPFIKTNRDLELQNLDFWYADYKGTVKHIYFKNKQLRDCLEKIEIKDLDEAKKFLYENGKQEQFFYNGSKSIKNAVIYRFIIHVPYESPTSGYAFAFTITEDNKFEFFFSMKNPKGKKELPMLGGFDETAYYKEIANSTDAESKIKQNALKLAINTLAFLKCDSAVITKSRPLEENLYTDNVVTVETTKQFDFLNSKNVNISKHIRNGHFRFYRADRYINRKGTTDFILPTEVSEHTRKIEKSPEQSLVYEKEDFEFRQELQNSVNDIKEPSFEYTPKPIELEKIIKDVKAKQTFSRNKQTSLNALARARYQCEYNCHHETFIRKNSDKNYTEAHHLIPLEYQQYFLPYSLDVEANIVSLCSNCHNKIHYGQNAAELVTKLYELRKSELEKCNINISLDELLELYK